MSAVTVRFAYWKSYRAVVEMASSQLPPRERLEAAVTSGIQYVFPLVDRPTDLPPEIAAKAAKLQARLTAQEEYGQTIRRMSGAEVLYMIREIVNLHGMLAATLDFNATEEPAPEGV